LSIRERPELAHTLVGDSPVAVEDLTVAQSASSAKPIRQPSAFGAGVGVDLTI
jgi:hypothetical protein